MRLNNEWVNKIIKEEIKIYFETKENETTMTPSNYKREIHSNPGLPQETREISTKQSNLISKGTRKGRTKPKMSTREEIIKIGTD